MHIAQRLPPMNLSAVLAAVLLLSAMGFYVTSIGGRVVVTAAVPAAALRSGTSSVDVAPAPAPAPAEALLPARPSTQAPRAPANAATAAAAEAVEALIPKIQALPTVPPARAPPAAAPHALHALASRAALSPTVEPFRGAAVLPHMRRQRVGGRCRDRGQGPAAVPPGVRDRRA